jgi:hypothetical protein
MLYCFFFFKGEEGIRDSNLCLEFRRVPFRFKTFFFFFFFHEQDSRILLFDKKRVVYLVIFW